MDGRGREWIAEVEGGWRKQKADGRGNCSVGSLMDLGTEHPLGKAFGEYHAPPSPGPILGAGVTTKELGYIRTTSSSILGKLDKSFLPHSQDQCVTPVPGLSHYPSPSLAQM